jgi:Zn-dependent protease
LLDWIQANPMHFTSWTPSLGWAIAAGLAAALVYALSVLLHELGHFAVARLAGVEVAALELNFAGGFVELRDDGRVTVGRFAAIVVAGPLVSGALALGAWALDGPAFHSGSDVAVSQVLDTALAINAIAFVVNLLPFRGLDGGQLLTAARLWAARV